MGYILAIDPTDFALKHATDDFPGKLSFEKTRRK